MRTLSCRDSCQVGPASEMGNLDIMAVDELHLTIPNEVQENKSDANTFQLLFQAENLSKEQAQTEAGKLEPLSHILAQCKSAIRFMQVCPVRILLENNVDYCQFRVGLLSSQVLRIINSENSTMCMFYRGTYGTLLEVSHHLVISSAAPRGYQIFHVCAACFTALARCTWLRKVLSLNLGLGMMCIACHQYRIFVTQYLPIILKL